MPARRKSSRSNSIDIYQKESSILSKLVTCVGNFSVQYNYQAVSVALIVMSVVQCTTTTEHCKDGEQESWVDSTATATVFIGSITGQLSMGYAGDILGRDIAMCMTLTIACISALLSAVAPNGSPSSVYLTIIVCRFFLGIGLGGVYPLAATKAAEDGSSKGANPVASAKAFFWQTPGSMGPWLVVLTFTGSSLSQNLRWRLLLGLGAIPSLFVVICSYLDSRNSETVKRTGRSFDEAEITAHRQAVAREMSNPKIWKYLIGTGGGWFLFDVCYYGVGLFGGAILSAMDDADDVTTDHAVRDVAWKQMLALGMGIPAMLLTMYMMEFFTLKQLQIIGFGGFVVGFAVMAGCFFPLKKQDPDALFVVYCFLLFVLQFGPNVTTYVLPATVFKKEVRATMNGFSAACGKLGAVFGAYLFGSIADASSYPTVMILCVFVSIAGAWVTYVYVPDEPDLSDYGDEDELSKHKALLNDADFSGHDQT